MSEQEKAQQLKIVLGQLRHAYAHLVNGTVGDQRAFANGLIAPQIERLEAIAKAEPPPDA
jgi:hypothetical protein